MSTVQPASPHTPTPALSGGGNTTALAVKVPPKILAQLQNLSLGQAVQATVTAQTAPNQIQVMTAMGPLTLQTAMTLPKGAVLTLILASLKPPAFLIGLVDGKAVPEALIANPNKVTGKPSSPTSLPLRDAPAVQAGTKLNAVLLRPAQGAPQAAPSSPAAPGAPQTAESAQATAQNAARPAPPPHPATAPLAQSPVPARQAKLQAAQIPARSNVSPTPLAPSAQHSGKALPAARVTLPSGTRFSVTIQTIQSPNTVLTTPISGAPKGLTQGQVTTGTVIGRTPLGQPIIQTPGATMALDTRSTLVEGTKVTVRFDSPPLPPEPSTAAQRLSSAGFGLGLINAKTWDDLGEALKILAAADPPRFLQVAHTALPQPGAKLTNQFLFFLHALKGGDIKALFGDTATRLIEKERPGLMARLGADFQVMSRMADEPQSGDWRLALIPLWSGQQLEQVRLYYRGGGEETGDEPDDARFVLDLDLSNLGHMQIDGLMKPTPKRLDLIIRTEQPLPAEMRGEITKITMAAQDLFGINATVSFQAKPANFVEFPPNAPPEQGLIA